MQDGFTPDKIYSLDFESLIGLIGTLNENQSAFACLDRVDMLITEQNSTVTKPQMIALLKALGRFRPKRTEVKDGWLDDFVLLRHKKLIEHKKD